MQLTFFGYLHHQAGLIINHGATHASYANFLYRFCSRRLCGQHALYCRTRWGRYTASGFGRPLRSPCHSSCLCVWLSQWRLTVGSAFALCGVLGLLLSLLIAGLLGLSAGTSVLTRSVACVILALLVSSFFAAPAVSLGMAGVTCLLLSLTVWRCDHASPFRFHVWHVLHALCARYAGPPLIAQARFVDAVAYRVLDHQICDPDAQDQRYQPYR